MAAELTFDPEALLAPISEDAPSGEDARAGGAASALYLQMKDARTSARRKERALDIDPDSPSALSDWEEVVQNGYTLLSEHTKDFEVCAWLIEALLRVDGFTGFHTGLQVALGLADAYWDVAYPSPDEDGEETRAAPFFLLFGGTAEGTLIQALRKVPLTAGEGYCLWQYQQADEISRLTDDDKRNARLAGGAVALDVFRVAVSETPAAFYADLVTHLEGAREIVGALAQIWDKHLDSATPPIAPVRAELDTTLDAVKLFAADKLAHAPGSEADDAALGASAEAIATGGEGAARPMAESAPATREQALRQLLEISAYFRKVEPHSPISYALEEIVRRARMSLGELLSELIVDDEARRYFYIASGLRPPESE